MTNRNYSSTAVPTTLAAPINDSQTSLTVSATTGFPAAPFMLVIDSQELVLVTGVAGTTLTVTRGYDSTSALSHLAGATVVHSHSAIDFRESRQHEAATSGVHGVTGSLVGTSDAQTLTNKTIGATNTINGFTAGQLLSSDGTGKAVASGKTVPTGAVVGTTDSQTLTNKTVALGSNTVSGTKAQFDAACTDADFADSATVSTHTASTTAHGATGAVVGTTNTQTLTNKDLTSGTNSFPSTLALSARESWHTVGGGGEPPFTNSWVAATGSVQFRIDGYGNVHIRGQITGGASGTVVFALPVGYRPSAIWSETQTTNTSGFSQLTVNTDGTVQLFIKSGTPTTHNFNAVFSAVA